MSKHISAHRSQAGFTLVELAIVMIIIGLLIGGVLKGQQLIANSQVTATVAQLKGTDAATSTFKDMYNGIPGDIDGARIANCAGVCDFAGANNDGFITSPFTAAPVGEGIAYFLQLSAADLLTGVNQAALATWGGYFPAGKISGTGLHVSSFAGVGALPNQMGAVVPNRGIYLALHGTQNGPVNNLGIITPTKAFQIDTKMDDGQPQTGSVRGAGAATCQTGTLYNEASNAAVCSLYVRIQG